MKRSWIIVVFSGLGAASMAIPGGGPGTAEAGGGEGGGEERCSAQNGDVNVDGAVDLSDAVTILGHLFLGSPTELAGLCVPSEATARIQELEAELAAAQAERAAAQAALVACQGDLQSVTMATTVLTAQVSELQAALSDCRAGSGAGLPDTGQTLCYSATGQKIPCDGATCPGQDATYSTGIVPAEVRFLDDGDGTVTDIGTGLMWQKSTGNDGVALGWCESLVYCEELDLAGHDDWRLPNVYELQSIVDYTRLNPSIDPVFDAKPFDYWTSTTSALNGILAWVVNFYTGWEERLGKKDDQTHFVRAVRKAW